MKNWYIYRDGQVYGPYSMDEMEEQVRSGTLTPDTLVWNSSPENAKFCVKASETELIKLFNVGSTPPPWQNFPTINVINLQFPMYREVDSPKMTKSRPDDAVTFMLLCTIILFLVGEFFYCISLKIGYRGQYFGY
jgi:hypothetical protein